jgi:hypothetical protein
MERNLAYLLPENLRTVMIDDLIWWAAALKTARKPLMVGDENLNPNTRRTRHVGLGFSRDSPSGGCPHAKIDGSLELN